MKFLLTFTISLLTHIILIFPTMCAETKPVSKSSSAFSISKIEIVPSFVEEIEDVKSVEKFHGGKKEIKTKEKMNETIVKGDEVSEKYLAQIRKKILDHYPNSMIAKRKKLKGDILLKIQIQNNGRFDILGIIGKNNDLILLTEQMMTEIKVFPPMPKDSNQKEVQLKIPLVFNY